MKKQQIEKIKQQNIELTVILTLQKKIINELLEKSKITEKEFKKLFEESLAETALDFPELKFTFVKGDFNC